MQGLSTWLQDGLSHEDQPRVIQFGMIVALGTREMNTWRYKMDLETW